MRKKQSLWLLAAVAVVTAMLLTACGGGQKPPAGNANGGGAFGDVALGEQSFLASCVACHGADAQGLPGNGKDLVNQSDWMQQQSDEDLLAMIKQGRSVGDPENTTRVDMPPKGGNPVLNDDDLRNIVAYIRSLQNK